MGCAAPGWLIAATLALPGYAAGEPYRLHPQDRLLIRVLTWDFNENSLTAWQGLSGEYAINPEGDLQLPLAGSLQAEGLTQGELSREISNLLRLRAGLEQAPQLSVELASSLPVYTLGDVQTRGAVAFRPGLTARQAMALAGGLFRDPVAEDAGRMILLGGTLAAAEEDLRAKQAEKTRIEGELAELQDAPPPVDPLGQPAGSMAQQRLQAADRMAREVRINSYDDLRKMLAEKVRRLDQQIALRDQQIASMREELAGIASLNERGLAVNARVTSLETALTELEAKRLELETATLFAEEQLNQAQRNSDTITTDAVAERLRRLVALEAEIPAAEIRVVTARQQIAAELARSAPAADTPDQPAPSYRLYRDGAAREIGPDEVLEPGDTLEIIRKTDLSATDDSPT